MIQIITFLLLMIVPTVSWADIQLETVQKQGFENFLKGPTGTSFSCKKQCFIVLSELGMNEFIRFQGKFSGKGEVGYGLVNGDQVVPVEFIKIGSGGNIEKTFLFTGNPFYSQIPKGMKVLFIVSGDMQVEGFSLDMNLFSPFERIRERFHEALEYMPFTPRSINFLEGPTWGGKYINEVFFSWIVFFLIVAFFASIFEKQREHHMKKSVKFGIGVLIFFWVFFDVLHSRNQYKLYQEFISATDIMENGRLGKNSDFYEFINYAKTIVPNEAKGAFISPYPFLIEGKYHSYPDIKFDEPEKVKYFIWYNPYGNESPFGYKNPVVNNGTLTYETGEYQLEKEVTWKEYAKIYILKK